ncbi:squamosa promoter-binding-like protein 1 isoform X1 [Durio zibethinus]|uniref:Squamosa promoter-binding-like protein 1 isoform X1 n=2 Tax=Durio zibethinus TaxID=66656 RepID=A0A6P5X243_DURZI|nr:squamosa promoter-binding-like protein 1 isoform X1 [Durio zibethinus]
MEAKFGGKPHQFYGPMVSDLKAVEKNSVEWDLNNWKWDGDLFTATPLNSVPSDCRSRQLCAVEPEAPVTAGPPHGSSSCSEHNNLGYEKGKRESQKRRIEVVDDDEVNRDAAALNLTLGGQVYPIMNDEAKCGKKPKVTGTTSSHAVCQVEDCRTDLSNAKDYHRRHRVCDMHSKASKALVGNVMQRFCQQCSRFHVLQEFDDGKRSCRRRLAGHNRRRRKTNPDNERSSSYLLISLLRILSNMHSNNSDQTKDQDLLSQLLRSLASLTGSTIGRNISGLPQGSQGVVNAGASLGNLEKVTDVVSNGTERATPSGSASKIDGCANVPDRQGPMGHCGTLPASDLAQKRANDDVQDGSLSDSPSKILIPSGASFPFRANEPEATVGRIRMNNIDLNNVYNDSQDYVDNLERALVLKNPVNGSLHSSVCLSESHKSSPHQQSGNSDSTSGQSPCTSSGEAQSCTNRIVFKLFGKDPNNFPIALRRQILDWLSHSPTDIESYIRPGCIILTIYLRLGESAWEELFCDLGSSLRRLVDMSNDSFWKTGWVYARVQHSVAFIYNGRVLLDTTLPLKSDKNCRISSIKPIAVSVTEGAQFLVKGFNLNQSGTRLLCAIEGKYLVQESCCNLMEVVDPVNEHDELQYLSFHCSIPNVSGRGFIEVEGHGLSSTFFPFIVAEQEVCSEICTLEGVIETAVPTVDINKDVEKMETKNQALDFIHEMGWLLHRNHLSWRLGHLNPNSYLFPFRRFKWLMEFSMDHDWCAVVKKLLGILFDGTIDLRDHSSIEFALLDMCLLHRAVQRNCRPMVELLLRYVPDKVLDKSGSEKPKVDGNNYGFMFKPNVAGPAGLTPLHVAASRGGSENVLDALTEDPGSAAIEAWRSARDSTGLTPNDYACLRGHYSYIHLVQRKINKKSECGHVVLDIPRTMLDSNSKQKLSDGTRLEKAASLETENIKMKTRRQCCKACEQKLANRNSRTSPVYRPAMLSMVAIAAVCVCMALLFKSSPEVLDVSRPFRWELLKYGSS